MSNAQNPRLEAALAYAGRSWFVFPCAWIEGGVCSCKDPECESPGKHPLTPHGLLDATNDPALVRDFWTKFPKANIAIATGAKSGIAVVDIDDLALAQPSCKNFVPAMTSNPSRCKKPEGQAAGISSLVIQGHT
jgi:hypothetical protein